MKNNCVVCHAELVSGKRIRGEIRFAECPSCGLVYSGGPKWIECPTCKGTKVVKRSAVPPSHRRKIGMQYPVQEFQCPKCEGRGYALSQDPQTQGGQNDQD
jgi:hypothetical protein